MNKYRVKRGPISPPASVYGPMRRLETGETVSLAPSPWLRRALREERLVEADADAAVDTAAGKRPRRSKS